MDRYFQPGHEGSTFRAYHARSEGNNRWDNDEESEMSELTHNSAPVNKTKQQDVKGDDPTKQGEDIQQDPERRTHIQFQYTKTLTRTRDTDQQ
jgi:hypothetical protein